jgi:hypothetical protein
MKYIEELSFGDFFVSNGSYLIKTTDFKKSKESVKYFCISMIDGSGFWLEGNRMVDIIELYKRDNDGNILPFKEYKDPYKEPSKT